MALVDIDRYRLLTGDADSTDDDVTAALVEAQSLLEEALRRPGLLESGEKEERLRLHAGGRVFPGALPITDPGDYTAEGASLVGASSDLSVGSLLVSVQTDTELYATVSYTGGYTADTVPATIARDIAAAAYDLLHPAPSDIPVGATSVRLGDAAVTFASPHGGGFTPSWSASSLRHRRRFV